MIRLEKVTKRFNQGTPDETEVFSCFDFSVNSDLSEWGGHHAATGI